MDGCMYGGMCMIYVVKYQLEKGSGNDSSGKTHGAL